MNNKNAMQFIALTFIIALVTSGICEFWGWLGFTIENASWLYILIALCAFSPTIASYMVLKRNGEVKNLKGWLKTVFAFKSPFRFYLLVLMLLVVYYVPQAIITGLDDAKPFHMFFAVLPLVLIGGGIEEAGWSYVLRPELDKKFGFILSSLIVGVIWALWHILVFLPQGRLESLRWFGLFMIMCIGLSFALGAIMRITKSVWLCVLFHTISNAVSGTLYEYSDSLFGNILSTGLLIVISVTVVFICEKKQGNLDHKHNLHSL